MLESPSSHKKQDRSFEGIKCGGILSPIDAGPSYCYNEGLQEVPHGGMLDLSNDLSERPMYTEVSLKFSKGLNSAGDTSQSQYSRREKIIAEP